MWSRCFSSIAQDQVSTSADSPDDVLLISPLVDVSTDSVPDVIRPVAPSPPMEQLLRRIGCGRRLLFRCQPLMIVARPQYPGGGWHGRARSWRSDLPGRSVHWRLVGHSGIRRTAVQTMTCLRGSLDCLCIIRGSLSGLGFRSPPAFWKWTPVGGWIFCHVMGPLLPPYNCNEMLVSCKPTLTSRPIFAGATGNGVETD